MAVRESFLKESPAPAAAEGGGAPRQLSRLAEELVASCRRTGCAHLSPAPIPDQEAVISLVRRLRRLMFPGYFHSQPITEGKARQILGQELAALWEDLSCQIALSARLPPDRDGLPPLPDPGPAGGPALPEAPAPDPGAAGHGCAGRL
jgi:hypothetical protein